jgi:D-tyrosyl-tRNA(Tyr) deacylase
MIRAVVQRVREASVSVDGREVAAIGVGLLVLAGLSVRGADAASLAAFARKLCGLRIFDDAEGRLNRSVADVDGEILLVPQITLTASLEKGTRPSFHTAAAPDLAEPLFAALLHEVARQHAKTKAGVFRADMVVRLENDGPVTFVLEAGSDG